MNASDPPGLAALRQFLNNLPRRYRATGLNSSVANAGHPDSAQHLSSAKYSHERSRKIPGRNGERGASARLAAIIEQARYERAPGEHPPASLKDDFVKALAALIKEATLPEGGDPSVQAMLLRYRSTPVRQFASLSSRAAQDRRRVRTLVNRIAHPAKLQQNDVSRRHNGITPARSGALSEALKSLYTAADRGTWTVVAEVAQRLRSRAQSAAHAATHAATHRQYESLDAAEHVTGLQHAMELLCSSPELERLQRLEELESHPLVRQYQAHVAAQGPNSRSREASEQGKASQQRGAEVEAKAAKAIELLADKLNALERASINTRANAHARGATDEPSRAVHEHCGAADKPSGSGGPYWVATSMRVPAALLQDADRAKTEWDVALLRRAESGSEICLLIEAKASVEAADTDFARLRRGLQLLGRADPNTVYSFRSKQGEVEVRGSSLVALDPDEINLPERVLYCCGAPTEAQPDSLNAASRMQLLSAEPSLQYASALQTGKECNASVLEALWLPLLESPQWYAVRNQSAIQRQVRNLMVFSEELMDAATAFSPRD